MSNPYNRPQHNHPQPPVQQPQNPFQQPQKPSEMVVAPAIALIVVAIVGLLASAVSIFSALAIGAGLEVLTFGPFVVCRVVYTLYMRSPFSWNLSKERSKNAAMANNMDTPNAIERPITFNAVKVLFFQRLRQAIVK